MAIALVKDVYLKLKTLETIVAGQKTNQSKDPKVKGINITISVNDEVDRYDNNVSAWVAQSQEERAAKKERFYVGNGVSFWTNGSVSLARDLKEGAPSASSEEVGAPLPF